MIAYVTNNKRLRTIEAILKLTTETHETSRGHFATAELLVINLCWSGSGRICLAEHIPCRVQRQHIVHHLHRLLSAARLSTGSAVVHCLHSGPSGEVRRILTRVCRRHAAVFTSSSHRHGVSCCTAGTVHHRCRPLDVCQPPQAQRGQN